MVVAEATNDVVVGTTAAFTWIESALDVEEAKALDPENIAVTVSEPTGRVETEIAASPLEREADPIEAEPL